MPPTSRTLFLSSYAVPIIFSPSITRCLFKETGRTIPSFLLFYPAHLIFFPPLVPPFSQLFPHSCSEKAIRHLSPPPIPILFHDTFMYRMSNIRGNRILSVSLATFPRHSFAMRRLREVNFSYGCLPLSLQLSSSRMEFLRFRRTLCNTLYSRDEQGGGRKGRRKGLASIIDVLSLSVSC